MRRTRVDPPRHRPPSRWARVALFVLAPLLLVACPGPQSLQAATAELRVSALGAGRVEVNGSFHALPHVVELPRGVELVLRAEADAGHAFERWDGTASGTSNPLTLTLNGAHDVVAVFVAVPEPATVTLDVQTEGDGSGRVTSIPEGIDCGATCTATFAPGTQVTLAATPDAGSTITTWTSCDTETDTTCTIALGADRTVTVSFGQDDPPPANDDFVDRATLTGDVGSAGARTSFATKEPGEPAHGGDDGGRSVWWTWTAPAAGRYVFDASASDFESVLGLYAGSSVDALTPLATEDLASGSRALEVSDGQVVQIAVDGAGGAGGEAWLEWYRADPEGAPAWRIAPASFELTADVGATTPRDAVLRNDGDAEGTFTASSDRTWLTVDPASGTLAAGADLALLLSVGCPAQGREVATLTVHGGGASAQLTVDRDCLIPSTVELTIDRFYVNQAVPAQDTLPGARSVPLVVDRDGLVRAFVTAAEAGTSGASVTLAHRCGGAGAIAEVPLVGPAQVPTATFEGDRSTVYERRLDADAICTDLQVAITASAIAAGGGSATARWPATGFVSLTTTTPPATSFVLVPVALNGGAAPSLPDPGAYLADVERMFPFGEGTIASVGVGAELAFSGDLTQGTAWRSLLDEVTTIANADPQGRHHIGVVTPPYDGGIAGIAWVGFGSTSYKAAVVWSKSGFAGVTAHELGHNWGRLHAPCGGVGGPDAAYPYDGGSIGVWGFDLANDALKDPTRYADLMGYCSPTWVSDYTYAAIAAFRAQYGFSVRAAAAPVPGVLLTGDVDHETGALTLDPVFTLDARPEQVPPGPYLAVGVAADGTEAFRVAFGTLEVSRHEIEPFRVFVPWRDGAGPRLASLRIERDGVVLVERVAGVRPAATPTVGAERTADGRVRLSWAASAYPWARVSDADDGTLLGVGHGGEMLVTPVGPRLRVRLGDGLNTLTVDVAY